MQSAHVLDQRRLLLHHPCGIEYALVGVEGDPRQGHGGGEVPAEHAVHGIYGVGVHVADPENMVEFVNDQFYGAALAEEGDRVALQVGQPHRGGSIELVVNRHDAPGTWRFGDGTVHHFAWDMESYENQDAVKFEIEGVGYTDISELKDRTYFKSVYVRTPSGALFELAVTTPKGWATDESPNELGKAFQVPPQFEAQREEILSGWSRSRSDAGRGRPAVERRGWSGGIGHLPGGCGTTATSSCAVLRQVDRGPRPGRSEKLCRQPVPRVDAEGPGCRRGSFERGRAGRPAASPQARRCSGHQDGS